jgi:hypothetical protein
MSATATANRTLVFRILMSPWITGTILIPLNQWTMNFVYCGGKRDFLPTRANNVPARFWARDPPDDRYHAVADSGARNEHG